MKSEKLVESGSNLHLTGLTGLNGITPSSGDTDMSDGINMQRQPARPNSYVGVKLDKVGDVGCAIVATQ